MNLRPTFLLGAAAAAVIAGAARAQTEDPLFLGTIVFTNLEPVAGERTGTTVTVLDTGDLGGAADLRVAEVLARVPGFNLRTNGGLGTQTGFTLRGASQNYVAVLIDGIDVTDPASTQTAFHIGGLTGAGLGRIEVIPGSHSALYGSRAVGGVIAIESQRATEPGLHHAVGAEYGSFDTRRLSYGLSYLDDRADLAVTLSHVATEGFSAADEADGNTEADGFDGLRLSFNGGYDADSGLRLTLAGFVDASEAGYDGYAATPPYAFGDADNTLETDSAGLRLGAEFAAGGADHSLALTRYRIERHFIEDFADYAYTGGRTGLQYRGATDVGAAGRVVFGAEVQRETYDQTGSYGEMTAENVNSAVFAELTWAATPDLDLSFSWRHDEHEAFGGFDTGRVAVAWRPAEGWVIRGQAGTGFRAPSFYELYEPTYGDATLVPEESRSFDLGVERRIGEDGYVRATAFWLEVDNLIDWTDGGTPWPDMADDGYAQVPGLSERRGLELAASLPVGALLTVDAGYTWMESTTNGSGLWRQEPENVLTLGLDVRATERIGARLDVKHVADRAGMPDYTLANAALTYDFGNGTEAYLRVENLLDEDYQLVDGYGTSDRALYAGIDARF